MLTSNNCDIHVESAPYQSPDQWVLIVVKHQTKPGLIIGCISAIKYPAPAAGVNATSNAEDTDDENDVTNHIQPIAGTLPAGASLSTAARGLLVRLLDRDPRVRMRNLRQLQQTAFYMGYNFDHVKTMKVSPKSILDRHFPDGPPGSSEKPLHDTERQHFENF